MSVRIFLDTNILVYTYSVSEPEKKLKAQALVNDNETVVSTQVLQELCNIITRKFKVPFEQASLAILECSQNNQLHVNTTTTILTACKIASKYKYSFYDSMIIASALESGATILFSEDLQHGQIIEQVLTIKNPF